MNGEKAYELIECNYDPVHFNVWSVLIRTPSQNIFTDITSIILVDLFSFLKIHIKSQLLV